MKYNPSLDGLRAVAILPVLIFHTLPDALKGGFTGVDIFFVLSGYLITSVVLYDIRDGDFSMRKFYLRRSMRLLPNAVCMIIITALLTHFTLMQATSAKVAEHGLWALCNLSNVFVWRTVGGYWGDSATSLPLLHTWSLAVEEQFYLFFPSFIWLLARSQMSHIFGITICIALASFGLSVYGTSSFPIATFYLLPTRAWELLFGAAIATFRIPIMIDKPIRFFTNALVAEIAGFFGLIMIAMSFVIVTDDNHFPGWIALLPTIGTVAVIASVLDHKTWVASILSTPLMVIIGQLSYSLYLWHWPLIVVGRNYAELTGQSRQLGAYTGAFLGIVLSVIAFYLVEKPLRLRGNDQNVRPRALATAVAFCMTISLLVFQARATPDIGTIFDKPVTHILKYNSANITNSAAPTAAVNLADVIFMPSEPRYEAWENGGIVHEWGNGPPRVLVFGSSHALMFGHVIDDICKEHRISISFLALDGHPSFFPAGVGYSLTTAEQAKSFDDARRRWLREWKPDVVLVIDRQDLIEVAEYDRLLAEFIKEVEPHTQHIIFFTQVPAMPNLGGANMRQFVDSRLQLTGSLPRFFPTEIDSRRKAAIASLEALERVNSKVQILHVDQAFYLEDGSVRYASGRDFLYYDNNHLSEAGCQLVREIVARAINAACTR